jgi:carbonic anhydrase
VVEHWNPFAHIRQDLFGFGDILAVKDGETLVVQTTSAGNASARVKKILALPSYRIVKAAGWRVVVHGWGLRGPRGKRKKMTLIATEL